MDYRPLAIIVENHDTGETLGGLLGFTLWSVLFITHLILPESMRNIGLGRRLLIQAEDEAIRRGCHSAWLDTFSFQAPGFYEKLGYIVSETIEDHPSGHSRFFLKKRLFKINAAN
jgi:GNAT superfamily N-acetyltransferase